MVNKKFANSKFNDKYDQKTIKTPQFVNDLVTMCGGPQPYQYLLCKEKLSQKIFIQIINAIGKFDETVFYGSFGNVRIFPEENISFDKDKVFNNINIDNYTFSKFQIL